MADMREFRGPVLKIERAKHHIEELEVLFDKHLALGETHAFEEIKPMFYSQTLKKPLPDHIATIVGDAVHNVRAALDHLYVILTKLNGQTPTRHTKFPFGDEQYVRSQLTTKNPNPSPAVMQAIIDKVRPFTGPNGDELMIAIHELDIADKHKILIPIAGEVIVKKMVLRNTDGSVSATFTDLSFGASDPMRTAIGIPDMLIDGGKPEHIEEPTLEIIFDKAQPMAGKNVIKTLRGMSNAASQVINDLGHLA